jgi:hypothetical protein
MHYIYMLMYCYIEKFSRDDGSSRGSKFLGSVAASDQAAAERGKDATSNACKTGGDADDPIPQ